MSQKIANAPQVNIIRQTKAKTPGQASKDGAQLKPVDDTGNAALLALLKVEAEARDAQTEAELVFLIANEMRKLTRARQVFVLRAKSHRKLVVEAVNSLETVDSNSPLINWVERITWNLKSDAGLEAQREFTLPAYCSEKDEETKTYPFKEFVWLPFTLKDGTIFGGVLMSREQHWAESDLVIAKRLSQSFSHAWAAITGNRRLRSKGKTRKLLAGSAIACIVLAMMIPVPIAALAPAEIVPAKPFIVTAPIDGVIDKILVDPNSIVATGQPLLKFVDTSLRNKLSIAERESIVARAKLKRYTQSAFDDPAAKRELRTAMSQLELKLAESRFAADLLAKTTVSAATSGLVVFNDKNEWVGRPVRVGERIMKIADPGKVRLKVEMAVDDAIVVKKAAKITVYLDSDPLHPIHAHVISAAHEARKTASDVLAYEIIAELTLPDGKAPRLGVRGTAQVYGEQAPLFFYLFRRPLSALRQKLGL